MRILVLAAALALAAPAAAQPDPAQILIGALEQAARNLPDEVRDFTMLISEGSLSTEFYVWREGGEILVTVDDENIMGSALLWPDLAALHHEGMDARDEQVAGVEYLRADSVEGRPVHVLKTPGLNLGWEEEDKPDTLLLFVDTETRQVLRLFHSAEQRPTGDRLFENGGRSEIDVTFGDYRETGGVTVPHRRREVMRLQLNLDAATREELRAQGAQEIAQAEAAGERGRDDLRLIRRMLSLYQGEWVAVESVIEEVRVNSGRPDWVTF